VNPIYFLRGIHICYFFFVERAFLSKRSWSDKDLVTIWDPPVKSDTGFVILEVDLPIKKYFFLKSGDKFLAGFKFLIYQSLPKITIPIFSKKIFLWVLLFYNNKPQKISFLNRIWIHEEVHSSLTKWKL